MEQQDSVDQGGRPHGHRCPGPDRPVGCCGRGPVERVTIAPYAGPDRQTQAVPVQDDELTGVRRSYRARAVGRFQVQPRGFFLCLPPPSGSTLLQPRPILWRPICRQTYRSALPEVRRRPRRRTGRAIACIRAGLAARVKPIRRDLRRRRESLAVGQDPRQQKPLSLRATDRPMRLKAEGLGCLRRPGQG